MLLKPLSCGTMLLKPLSGSTVLLKPLSGSTVKPKPLLAVTHLTLKDSIPGNEEDEVEPDDVQHLQRHQQAIEEVVDVCCAHYWHCFKQCAADNPKRKHRNMVTSMLKHHPMVMLLKTGNNQL